MEIISDSIKEQPEISITYFKPDERKNGGKYVTAINSVKKIDKYERIVVMTDGTLIPIDEIISVECEIFEAIVLHSCDE